MVWSVHASRSGRSRFSANPPIFTTPTLYKTFVLIARGSFPPFSALLPSPPDSPRSPRGLVPAVVVVRQRPEMFIRVQRHCCQCYCQLWRSSISLGRALSKELSLFVRQGSVKAFF